MKHIVTVILFVLALQIISSCDHDIMKQTGAIARAKKFCKNSDLHWLEGIIQESETDYALKGNIYAVLVDEHTVFVHQPFIMSCQACLIYDCDGNRIAFITANIQKAIEGMTDSNLIHKAILE